MKLVVLNYEVGNVQVVSNIPERISDVEELIYETLGYKYTEIAWILLGDDFQVVRYTYDPALGKKTYDNENLLNND